MLNSIVGLLDAGAGAANSYESIQTYTVGAGGQSTISFTSIPSTYKHLQIRVSARVDTDSNLLLRVGNGSVDSGSSYSWHQIYGTGSAVGASSGANQTQIYLASLSDATSNFGAAIVDILDYANTNKYKTIRSLDGYDENGAGVVDLASGSWRNTAAITNIELRNAGNFTQYSSFALYGIKG